MTEFRIPVHPTRYNEVGQYTSEHVLQVGGVRHMFGYVSPAGKARHVYQGPALPGPYAFMFGLGTCIDNYGGTGAEAARNRAAGIEADAEVGDQVIIDGYTFEIIKTGHRNYDLRLVHKSLDINKPKVGDVLDGSSTNLQIVEVLGRDGGKPRVKVQGMGSDGTARGSGWEITLDPQKNHIAYRPTRTGLPRTRAVSK